MRYKLSFDSRQLITSNPFIIRLVRNAVHLAALFAIIVKEFLENVVTTYAILELIAAITSGMPRY